MEALRPLFGWGWRGGRVCWANWVPRLPPLEMRESRTELEDVKRHLNLGHSTPFPEMHP